VATVDGNRFAIRPQSGRVVPNYRTQGPVSDANLFEAVGAVSGTRTIRRETDAALRVIAPVLIEADSRAWIVRSLDRGSDLGQWIIRLIQFDGDLAARISRPVSTRGDTRQAVSAEFNAISDSRHLVIHSEARETATRQTIFAVLIRESHEIQT